MLNLVDVAFGTYGALSVSWEDPNDANPATNQHILGAYGATVEAYFMDADSLVVSVDDAELTGLDFVSDLSLAVVFPVTGAKELPISPVPGPLSLFIMDISSLMEQRIFLYS